VAGDETYQFFLVKKLTMYKGKIVFTDFLKLLNRARNRNWSRNRNWCRKRNHNRNSSKVETRTVKMVTVLQYSLYLKLSSGKRFHPFQFHLAGFWCINVFLGAKRTGGWGPSCMGNFYCEYSNIYVGSFSETALPALALYSSSRNKVHSLCLDKKENEWDILLRS
jgi:hypothetical protein